MLRIYGSLMPFRVLEEIRFWKMQEREHSIVIQELAPALEAPYVALLQQWEGTFGQTEAAAQQWIETVVRLQPPISPYIEGRIQELLRVSVLESGEFIRQLFMLMEQSAPIKASPVIKTVVMHIIRESEYFLGVLHAVQLQQPVIGPDGLRVPATETVPPAGPQAPLYHQPTTGPGRLHEPVTGTVSPAGPQAPLHHQPTTGQGYLHEPATGAVSPAGPQAPSHHQPAEGPGNPHEPPGEALSSVAYTAGESTGDAYLHVLREQDEAQPQAASVNAERISELTATQEGVWSGTFPSNGDSAAVPVGGHRLPPLPYAYNALEPHIDAETMRLHHDKHHQTYVDGLNKAEKKLAQARESGDFELIKHWEREAAFHGAGHYLHTLFWESMKPGGGGKATGEIAAEIKRSFGGFDAFRNQFGAAADKVEGGGWAILVWSPRSHRLEILQAEKHQNLSQWDTIPLLPLDVWEHAYYLKYKNVRAKYIEAWWNTVNWDHVNERFASARQLKWPPF